MRRRDFLITGSTGAMIAMALPAMAKGVDPAVLDVVLYEPRYLAAREFASRMVDRGARAFGTDECIVQLWRGVLADSLDLGETRIAGLTLHSDFEIARECARDEGLRVLRESLCRCEASSLTNGTSRSVTLVSWLIGT
ncbi:MAG: hypothetical protein WDO56_35905 [Gammaproteobacteria bacterium]